MNKKLLLGALIGAGISLLNKRRRQQAQAPDISTPDFSRPESTGDMFGRTSETGTSRASAAASGGGGLGDILGSVVPAGSGASVLMDVAKRIFQQMQPQGGAPAGAGGGLDDIFGQIFGRMGGKFNPQAQPRQSPQGNVFGFAGRDSGAAGEEQAELMLRAMVAAAQADGRIDEAEQSNIFKALEGQLDSAEIAEFRQFLTEPVDIDEVVSRVRDPATAFDIYLVSAMTIQEDNPREHAYMDQLAQKLGISEQAVHVIETQLPHAA